MNCKACGFWKKTSTNSELGLCLYHSNALFITIITRDCMSCSDGVEGPIIMPQIGQEIWL